MKKLFFILLLLASRNLKAQETSDPATHKIQAIVASLDSFRNKTPIEKIHLQLDKPYYALGDIMWIKAYVVNENNGLSNLSKIVYIDLINDKDSVKESLKLPVAQGLSWGTFTLSDSLFTAGNYHIRAYTNLMRNFGEEYFFDRSIKISNPLAINLPSSSAVKKNAAKNTGQLSATKKPTVEIQFFPEGGDLVDDITSVIAFKAIGADGLGRDVSGFVTDKDNKQIVAFKSEHGGMGTFSLQPVAGNTYTAVVKFADGSQQSVQLPKTVPQGYTLAANQNNDNILVHISASSSLLNKGEIILIAQNNNNVYYTGKKVLTTTDFNAAIPKSRFPEGILQLTLFSANSQPVAERLLFIHHNDNHLNIKVTPDSAGYSTRSKVHIDLQVTDQQGTPVAGSFSLAVNDEGKVPFAETDETTIFSNLLLTGDLKGYVEKPNYYFTESNADKDRELDNLLLTQGWRRFTWKDVLANNFPKQNYQAESGINISGRVLTAKNKPVDAAKVFLLLNSGGGMIIDTVTNADGKFSFNDLTFKKGISFNLSASNSKKTKDLKVVLDVLPPQPVTLQHFPETQLPDSALNTYTAYSRKQFDEQKKYGYAGIILKEVTITEKSNRLNTVKAVAVQHSSNLAGPGNADQVLTFIDLLTCNGQIGDCLNGRVTGVVFRKSRDGSTQAYARGFDAPMAVMVDGVPGRKLDEINSNDVASIEVLRGGGAASLYGNHGANGVLVITTKKGDVDYASYEMEFRQPGSTKTDGLQTYVFQGYDMRRQFYSPNYFNPEIDKQMGDFRSTIYWKPNVITDDSGKASVEFFNADGKGQYRLTTEGLDGNGKLGRQVFRFTVK
ncbi:MAG TPA: TonB-dependent receptor plug domain-containing protein [Mucilaginibacter sp.]|jgi:TonB-dependent SusC/RagA subfamily outer membrane receptor|nr:TonB-dependent receptor plug domain-containing protein [Mucilaginibacter sp.]